MYEAERKRERVGGKGKTVGEGLRGRWLRQHNRATAPRE
jgi:hypothetical protein